MVRILHILERDADFETRRSVESLERALGEGLLLTIRTVGRGGTWRDGPTGAAALRREPQTFDLIHAWGGAALTISALGTRLPIIFSPTVGTKPRTLRWLNAVLSYRSVQAICATSTMQRALLTRGVPLNHCHLIRPGVDFARATTRRDAELRQRLGFGTGDRVILAIGESTRSAAHTDAAWAAGILHVADPRYRLLLWGRGPHWPQVQRLARSWRLPRLVTVAGEKLRCDIDPERLASVADLALISARGPVATLPISMVMAAGVPIVSTVTRTASELLEDRHTALMTPPRRPRLLARRILDLEEDSSTRWSIADMARTEAYDYFAMTRFVNQFRAVYRQVTDNQPVEVPQPAAGAGLRFHGRA